MLKVQYKYSDKEFLIAPYNSAQEKDLLLLGTVGEENIDIALDICGLSDETISSLTQDEKIAFLYKFREISVGAEINLKFKCNHCQADNENSINIEDIIESGHVTNNKITDQYKVVTDENLSDYISADIYELDLDEYEAILSEVKATCTKFNFRKPTHCQKCTKENKIRINDVAFAIDTLSDDSLISIYQTYNDLVFHGSYTKQDVDSMYPFERTILISLLNKSREELNQ